MSEEPPFCVINQSNCPHGWGGVRRCVVRGRHTHVHIGYSVRAMALPSNSDVAKCQETAAGELMHGGLTLFSLRPARPEERGKGGNCISERHANAKTPASFGEFKPSERKDTREWRRQSSRTLSRSCARG